MRWGLRPRETLGRAAGTGFSSHASDGTFRKHKTRYGLGVLIFLLIVSVIIFLVMLISGDIDLSVGGLVIFGAVMAILWTFWILWYIIDNRKVKSWDGVVTRREQETTRYVEKDEEGYRHTREQTAYRVWFRTDTGKTKKLVQYDKPAWYNYLNEGERVRYHGGKNYYEKYDKSPALRGLRFPPRREGGLLRALRVPDAESRLARGRGGSGTDGPALLRRLRRSFGAGREVLRELRNENRMTAFSVANQFQCYYSKWNES